MGLIQTIRLMLDRAALQQLQRDAAAASRLVAETLTRELGSGKSAEQAVLAYALRLRRVFEKKTEELRVNVAKGLISVPEAERAAQQLGEKFTAKLAQHLKSGAAKNLGTKTKKAIIDAAIPKPEELSFAAGNAFSQMWAKLSAKFSVPNLKLMNIPAAQPLTGRQEKAFMTQAKGDINEYNRLVRNAQNEQRVFNTTLTTTGRILQGLGINVRKMSSEYKALGGSTRMTNTSMSQLIANGKLFQAGLMGIGKAAMAASAAMLSFVAAGRIMATLKQSFIVAADTEATWRRLAVSLADFGISAESAWPAIDRMTKRLSGLGYKPTFTAEVMATLVQLTGNYEKSLAGVETVLDLVISRHMTWETAARLVGRTIIGNTGHAGRFGIVLEETGDAFKDLQDRFANEAVQRSLTLKGQLDRAGVAWFNFQNGLGQTIAQGMKAVGFFETLSTTLQSVSAIFDGSRGLIQALVRVVGWFLKFIAMVTILIDSIVTLGRTVVNVGALIGIGFANTFKVASEGWSKMWRSMFQVALITAENVAKVIKFMTGGIIDATEAIQKIRVANQTELARLGSTESGSLMQQRFQNRLTKTKMDFLGMSTGEVGNPLVTGLPLGNPREIKYHEEQKINQEILRQRRNALFGTDERSEAAMERLNEMYAEQQKRLSEVVDNAGKRLIIENHLTNIEKIRADMEKKRAAEEKKRTQDEKINQRIALLARVALLDKDEDSKRALAELAEIEKTINTERDKTVASSERYFILTDRLLKIEEARLAVTEKQAVRIDEEIAALGERVELDVDREQALERLVVLQQELQGHLVDENRTRDERLRIQRQLLQIDKALQIEDDRTMNQIERYKQWLTVAEKREMAEYRLVALRRTLQDQLDKALMTQERRLRVELQLAAVEEALTNKFDVRSKARAVSSVEDAAKNNLTRRQALEIALKLQLDLNEAMEKGNLTTEETIQVLSLLERLRRRIRTLEKPTLDFWKDLSETLKTDLIPEIEKSAATMADHMINAFERMSSALNVFGQNAKNALRSIPQSVLAAMTDGIKKIAQDKIKEHIAEAAGEAAKGFGMLAVGNLKGSALAFKSSAMHMLAAAKWGLLGGAAGAATTGLLGGGSSSSTGRNAKDDKQIGPEIHLYIDGVDPTNTRHQNLIRNTIKQAEERWGVRVDVETSRSR